MLIGVPREIKVHEYRVGLTPESVLVKVKEPLARERALLRPKQTL